MHNPSSGYEEQDFIQRSVFVLTTFHRVGKSEKSVDDTITIDTLYISNFHQPQLGPSLTGNRPWQDFLAVLAAIIPSCVCVCCFVLLNQYWGIVVWSLGFIVSEPRETHPRSEIADVPTSPCPPLDNLGCLNPNPPP